MRVVCWKNKVVTINEKRSVCEKSFFFSWRDVIVFCINMTPSFRCNKVRRSVGIINQEFRRWFYWPVFSLGLVLTDFPHRNQWKSISKAISSLPVALLSLIMPLLFTRIFPTSLIFCCLLCTFLSLNTFPWCPRSTHSTDRDNDLSRHWYN